MKDYKALYEKQKELIEIQKQYIDWINRHEPNAPVSMRGKQMLLESIKIESELAELEQQEKCSPSDEEIEVKATKGEIKHHKLKYYEGFYDGSKWCRDYRSK